MDIMHYSYCHFDHMILTMAISAFATNENKNRNNLSTILQLKYENSCFQKFLNKSDRDSHKRSIAS